MSLGLQVRILQKFFKKFNPELDFETYVDLDLLDNLATYRDNLEIVKKYHLKIIWELPRKEEMPKEAVEHNIEQKGKFTVQSYKVRIKKQAVKAKGRIYVCGRIQLTVDKELIGRRAKITVIVPNVTIPKQRYFTQVK
jgi:hypothetical protein